MRWIDLTVTAGIVALVVLTPIALGAVHPPAYSLMEAIIFALVVVWMVKAILAGTGSIRYQGAETRALTLPLFLFLGFVAFQLLPIPPCVERVVSPSTYGVYQNALPGWPDQVPYAGLAQILSASKPEAVPIVLPSASEVQSGAAVPSTIRPDGPKLGEMHQLSNSIWRPLSINPAVTKADLLKLTAYVSFFFLVMLYPFGEPCGFVEEATFYNRVFVAVLLTGLLVAVIALVEQVTWNGKILWTVIPYDWGAPQLQEADRARGPFVNPDHLAAYLNLALPFSIAGIFFPETVGRKNRSAFRVLCAVTAIMIVSALIMSLSRAGWIGLLLGFISFVALCGLVPAQNRPQLLRMRWGAALPLTALLSLLLFAGLFVGPEGRSRADVRLQETVVQQISLPFRLHVWRDTLPMIRDFSLFGIGLNCFEDLFPHYQSPPWIPATVPAAHNDYLQLMAETGLLGSALLTWFFVAVGRRLYHGLAYLSPTAIPVVAALLAASVVLAFHELFDFGLHIPAIALLFTLMLAIGLRLNGLGPMVQSSPESSSGKNRLLASAVAIAAVALIATSLGQDRVPYPFNVGRPGSVAEATNQVGRYPASFRAHYGLLKLIGPHAPFAERIKEIKAAAWLQPTNPYIHDAQVMALLESGRRQEALSEMESSLRDAPPLRQHLFLQSRLIPWLAEDEREAIKKGLQEAVDKGYAEAVNSLASFCWTIGDYPKVAAVYRSAAAVEKEPRLQAQFLTGAGSAYRLSNDGKSARAAWRSAIDADPTYAPAYEPLFNVLLVEDHDVDGATALASQGIDAGADPVALYASLARVQQDAGNESAAEASLLKALSYQPSNFDVLWDLGGLYLNEHAFDRAAIYIAKAADLRPKSADAFFRLAVAQEGAYHYADAETAYNRALALDPANTEFKSRYDSLRRKLAENRSQIPPSATTQNQ